jgi:hypothetical protein
MRSVSEQPSAAGVADQLHGKISEKLASAVWIRPVGRLSNILPESSCQQLSGWYRMLICTNASEPTSSDGYF